MQYAITGANGQLGQEMCRFLEAQHINFVALNSTELDITNRNLVLSKINELHPDVIFHCAAYTAVDAAEDDGRELNQQVNVDGTQNIVDAAKQVDATLIYISTDYVFDGQSSQPYEVTDSTAPQTEYGRAKLAGERIVVNQMAHYYIIRTSWLYGEFGHNFVYTMLKLAESHNTISVVDDQFGRPTWTRSLAEFMLYAVQNNVDYGIYQLCDDGECSWFEFAATILNDKSVKVEPISSAQYPQKAYRPKYSVMSLDKVKQTGFVIPIWQKALESFLNQISH